MSLRARLVGVVAAVTMATLGGAFAAVFTAVNASQEQQLDDALREQAREEAAAVMPPGAGEAHVADGPGPAANDVGPLVKYEAVYGPDGRALDTTANAAAALARLPPSAPRHSGECFDLALGPLHLRATVLDLPGHPGARLLLAAPRTDLDGDRAFLARAMAVAFLVAVLWAALVSSWIVARLTRDHQAIASTARRVAGGDLRARVSSRSSDPELFQLARDVDDMIARLETLVTSQQRFIAHAAHELRSPLTTLYGELSHALRRSRDAEAYRAAIEEALDSTRRLKTLTEDLLALARLSGPRDAAPESFRSDAVVEAAVRSVAGAARERGVTVRAEGEAMTLRGTPGDVERMVRNLLENAVRHSPSGGAVVVRTRALDGAAEIAVSDEGPGVPEGERERIFEPFYRGASERARDGTGAGLGLAIAREVARAHGGEVRVRPAGARGTCFAVELPG